ncbi:hypothetical protein, partial [Acidianus sp. RZ1]
MLTRHIDIVLTTSRYPSPRVRSFLKELNNVIPFSVKINRGKQNFESLIRSARKLGAKYLFLISSNKGNPEKIHIYELYSIEKVYEMKIDGVSLLAEHRYRSLEIKRLCLGKIECKEMSPLLIYFGVSGEECRYTINIFRESNLCIIKFLDNFNRLI